MIYAKLIGGFAILMALVWGGLAYTDSVKKSQKDTDQLVMDSFKESIQKTTDQAIATATKERDDALTANEAIQNGYQTQLSAANANAADFAQRLRRAEANIAANRSSMPKAGGGPGSTNPSSQAGDVQLTNALGAALAECSANAAQLDALIVELKPQLGDYK